VGSVILGILAAAVLVVVLDEVFKQRGVEVELLGEDVLKAERYQFVDDGLGEGIALGGDILGDCIKEDDLLTVVGLN
jgi:hypothetical protein